MIKGWQLWIDDTSHGTFNTLEEVNNYLAEEILGGLGISSVNVEALFDRRSVDETE